MTKALAEWIESYEDGVQGDIATFEGLTWDLSSLFTRNSESTQAETISLWNLAKFINDNVGNLQKFLASSKHFGSAVGSKNSVAIGEFISMVKSRYPKFFGPPAPGSTRCTYSQSREQLFVHLSNEFSTSSRSNVACSFAVWVNSLKQTIRANMEKLPTLADYSQIAMSRLTSENLLRLLMVKSEPQLVAEVMPTTFENEGFLGKVFARRLCVHGVKIQVGAALFILSLLQTPGDSTLWVWTLFNMQRDADHVLTIDDIVEKFPMGFPSTDSYSKCWDAQKSKGGNLLDNQATWVRKTPVTN